MFVKTEIKLIKEIIGFNKEDIIRILNNLKENNKDNLEHFNKLIEEVQNNEYETIIPDFSNNIILGYYLDTIDWKIVLAYGKDFYFAYDNELHKLIIDSYSFIDIIDFEDCDGCNASKYGGFSKCVEDNEYCLKHKKELVSINGKTLPCKECMNKDFEIDTWSK